MSEKTATRLDSLVVDTTYNIVAMEWQRLREEIERLREENKELKKVIENADYLLSDAQPNDRVANPDAWWLARTLWNERQVFLRFHSLRAAEDEG